MPASVSADLVPPAASVSRPGTGLARIRQSTQKITEPNTGSDVDFKIGEPKRTSLDLFPLTRISTAILKQLSMQTKATY
jgi:hypothetical protein